ncbi:MAG: tetratricopeptide repeat protein [bacterium]|nr:tetratricopeptide repeat protein [bacterium]
MRRRIPLLRVIVMGAAFLAGCAPRAAVLIPAPPAGIAKAVPAKAPGAPPPSPASTPGPDPASLYRDAVTRTRELLAKGEGRKAIPLWGALEGSPFAAEAVFNQGVLLHLSGDVDRAEELYRRAAAPPLLSQPAAANLLGIALLRGNRETLRNLVDDAGRTDAARTGERMPELSANLVAALFDLSRFDEAETLCRSVLKTGRTTAALPWSRALLSYRRGDLAGARQFSSTLPPPVAALWPVVASRTAWERETAKVPPLDAKTSGEPRYLLLSRNLAAYEAWGRKDLDGSAALLATGTSGKSPPGEYLNNLGIVLAEVGRWKEAKNLLERTVAEAPYLPEGWLNLGMFREMYLGDIPGALSCYERYGKLNGARKDEVSKWSEWLRKSSSPR